MDGTDETFGRRIVAALRVLGLDPAECAELLESAAQNKEPAKISSHVVGTPIDWSSLGHAYPSSIRGIQTLGELAMLRESEVSGRRKIGNGKRMATLRKLLAKHNLRFRGENESFEARANKLFGGSDELPLHLLAFASNDPHVRNPYEETWRTIGEIRATSSEQLRTWCTEHPDLPLRHDLPLWVAYGVEGLPQP